MAKFYQISPDRTDLFVKIFDKYPDPVFLWKRHSDGTIRLEAFNPAAEKSTNYKIENYTGISVHDLYSDKHEILNDVLSVFDNQKNRRREFEYSYKTTGKKVWLAVDYIHLEQDIVMVTTKNIDRTVNLAKLAEDSTEMLRAMFAVSADAHVIANAKGDILLTNEGAVKMFGYDSMEEFKQRSTKELYSSETVRSAFLKMLDHQICTNCTISALRKNQKKFRALLSGAKITLNGNNYYYGHLKDLSDISKIENELCETEYIYENIMSQLKDGIILLDKKGLCQRINPAALEIFDTSLDEIKGKSLRELALKENPSEIIFKVYTHLDNKGSDTSDLSVKLGSQSIHYRISILYIAEWTLISLKDISDLRKQEEDQQRAQRMETIGRIAGQISHDFNNLLSPLIVIPEILRKRIQEDSKSLKLINLIQRAGEEMSEINVQLKSLASCGHYEFRPVDMDKVFKDLLSIMVIPDRIQISQDFQPDLMMVTGDESQLMRVMMNLLRNALDAIPDSGVITCKLENINIDEPLPECPQLTPGNYVKITLTDTGCGILPKHSRHIFDPFFTTKQLGHRTGLGLGLNIVWEIISDHNGSVNFTSIPGNGTSFYIYLPVNQEKIQISEEGIANFHGHESILIVDDNPFHIESMNQMLKDLGYKITLASSAKEVLNFIPNRMFDLIILDIRMPEMSGVELFREIIKYKPNQKALLVSGYAESDQVQEANYLGVSGFMTKPIRYRELAITIRKILCGDPV